MNGKKSKANNLLIKMNETKKVLILFFIYILSINKIYSIEPDVFVQSTVNRASKVLSEDISKEKKMRELQIIAKDTVDIKGIGFILWIC